MDKTKETRTKQVHLRMTDEEYAAIEKKAAEENRTVSNYIRTAIKEYMDK
jgi:hypothetical protein